VEKGDGLVDRVVPLASSKELKSFSHLFTQSVKKKFSDGHLWFSVFSRPVRSNFTRLQRISCCISLLFCTMISNAMFYRQDTQSTKSKAGVLMKIGPIEFTLTQLWISFIGTLVVLPINLIIVTLFRKAKYNQRILITDQVQEKICRNNPFKIDGQYDETTRLVVVWFDEILRRKIYLDFFHRENIAQNIQDLKKKKKISNVLEQYHLQKIKQEHFLTGIFTSLGLVRSIEDFEYLFLFFFCFSGYVDYFNMLVFY
jgi:hypothetical protein